jgi:hypothetical protein
VATLTPWCVANGSEGTTPKKRCRLGSYRPTALRPSLPASPLPGVLGDGLATAGEGGLRLRRNLGAEVDGMKLSWEQGKPCTNCCAQGELTPRTSGIAPLQEGRGKWRVCIFPCICLLPASLVVSDVVSVLVKSHPDPEELLRRTDGQRSCSRSLSQG